MSRFAAAVAVSAALVLVGSPAFADHEDVEVAPGSVNERDGRVRITLTRCREEPGSLAWNVQSGSATAGRDFEPTSGSRVLEEGEREVTFDLVVLQDEEREQTETIEIQINTSWPAPMGPVSDPSVGEGDCPVPGPRGNFVLELPLYDDDVPASQSGASGEAGFTGEDASTDAHDDEQSATGSGANHRTVSTREVGRAGAIDRAPTAAGVEVAAPSSSARRTGSSPTAWALGLGAAAAGLIVVAVRLRLR